ncbi:hypothetical protein EDB19DRAFT_1829331 [Suillus lakei]|nr:hypothetical protein EDB19DRAFT_1829331 [Suillus lakei]
MAVRTSHRHQLLDDESSLGKLTSTTTPLTTSASPITVRHYPPTTSTLLVTTSVQISTNSASQECTSTVPDVYAHSVPANLLPEAYASSLHPYADPNQPDCAQFNLQTGFYRAQERRRELWCMTKVVDTREKGGWRRREMKAQTGLGNAAALFEAASPGVDGLAFCQYDDPDGFSLAPGCVSALVQDFLLFARAFSIAMGVVGGGSGASAPHWGLCFARVQLTVLVEDVHETRLRQSSRVWSSLSGSCSDRDATCGKLMDLNIPPGMMNTICNTNKKYTVLLIAERRLWNLTARAVLDAVRMSGGDLYGLQSMIRKETRPSKALCSILHDGVQNAEAVRGESQLVKHRAMASVGYLVRSVLDDWGGFCCELLGLIRIRGWSCQGIHHAQTHLAAWKGGFRLQEQYPGLGNNSDEIQELVRVRSRIPIVWPNRWSNEYSKPMLRTPERDRHDRISEKWGNEGERCCPTYELQFQIDAMNWLELYSGVVLEVSGEMRRQFTSQCHDTKELLAKVEMVVVCWSSVKIRLLYEDTLLLDEVKPILHQARPTHSVLLVALVSSTRAPLSVSVAGGVAVINVSSFISKFDRKHFTDFDDNEAIKWPELKMHHGCRCSRVANKIYGPIWFRVLNAHQVLVDMLIP